MTAPLAPDQKRKHHTQDYRLRDEPNDVRRPPTSLTITCDIKGAGVFRFKVIGVRNYRKQKIQVDLVQAIDPGCPMRSTRQFQRIRDAIYEGMEKQGYEGWGLERSMVDLKP